jgi:ferredoxin
MELIIFLIVTILTILLFVQAVNKKLKYLRLAAKENRFDNPGKRFANFCANVLGQRKLLQAPYGVVHFFIFWGFIFIALGEIPLILERVFPGIEIPILGTNPYFYLIKDILSSLVFIGLIIGIVRRWIIKPKRLYRSAEAAIVVILIYGVIITEWLTSGAKLALLGTHAPYSLDFIYNTTAGFFAGMTPESLTVAISYLWWIHILILFGFAVYIPNSKHLHILATPFNSYFASLKPIGGQITPMNFEDESLKEYGVGRIENFTWKQLFDCFACGECGRCMDNCPANISGKPLNPKHLLSHTLKNHLLEKGAVMDKLGITSTAKKTPRL